MIFSQQQTYPRQGCQSIEYGTMNVPAMTGTGQMHKKSNQSLPNMSHNHPQEKAFKGQDPYSDRSAEGSEVEQMTDIVRPHPHDVLCGRGGSSNRHIGNTNFRDLVNCNKALYVTLTKRQKMMVARSIVQAVRGQTPRGRFLQKDPVTGLWCDIGRPRALEKTSQALREKSSGTSSDSKVSGKQDKTDTDNSKNKNDGNKISASSSKTSESNLSKKKKLPTDQTLNKSSNPDVIPPITIPAHLPQFRCQQLSFSGHQDVHNSKHPRTETQIPRCRSHNNLPASRAKSSYVENNMFLHKSGLPPGEPARPTFRSHPQHNMYVNEGPTQVRRIPQSSPELHSRSPPAMPSKHIYLSTNYRDESYSGNFPNQGYQGNYPRNHFHNQYHQGASNSPNSENNRNVGGRSDLPNHYNQRRQTITDHRLSNSHSSQEMRLPPYPPMHPHSVHGMKENGANRGVIICRDDRQRTYSTLHDQSRGPNRDFPNQYYNNCPQGHPHPSNVDYNRHLHHDHHYNSERQPPYDRNIETHRFPREESDVVRFRTPQPQAIQNSPMEGQNFAKHETRAYSMPPSASNQPPQYMPPNDSVSLSHEIHNKALNRPGSSTQDHFYDANSYGKNPYQNGNQQGSDPSPSMYVTSDYDHRQEMPRIPQVSLTPSTCESHTQLHPQPHHSMQKVCSNRPPHLDGKKEYFCNDSNHAPKLPPLHMASLHNQSTTNHHSNQKDIPHNHPDFNHKPQQPIIKPDLSNAPPNNHEHKVSDNVQETIRKRPFEAMSEGTWNNQSNSNSSVNDCEHLSKYFQPPTPPPSESLDNVLTKKRCKTKSSEKNPSVHQSTTVVNGSTFVAMSDDANIVTPGNAPDGNDKNGFISSVVSATLSTSSSMDETTVGPVNANSRQGLQSISAVSRETTFLPLGGLAALSKAALLISDDDR